MDYGDSLAGEDYIPDNLYWKPSHNFIKMKVYLAKTLHISFEEALKHKPADYYELLIDNNLEIQRSKIPQPNNGNN